MPFFRTIDDFLIDRVFQRISDWWADRTGKSNFWLAKVSFWAGLTTWSAIMVSTPGQSPWSLVLFLVVGFWFLYKIREMEHRDAATQSGKLTGANSMRIDLSFFFFRCSILAITTPFVVLKIVIIAKWKHDARTWILLLDDIAWLCLAYFPACTPKPPKPVHVDAPLAEPSRA